MAQQDNTVPVEHGIGSATAITAGEAGKGLFRGAGQGLVKGIVIGGLLTAAAPVIGLSLLGASLGTIAAAGIIAAIPGAYFGGLVGTPVGAAAGTLGGIGRGVERIGRDGAAAQVARNQEMTAQAQVETAQAMQARVMERMMAPPAPDAALPFPQPETKISHAQHHGQGLAHAIPKDAGAHVQRHHQQQAMMAGAEQQL